MSCSGTDLLHTLASFCRRINRLRASPQHTVPACLSSKVTQGTTCTPAIPTPASQDLRLASPPAPTARRKRSEGRRGGVQHQGGLPPGTPAPLRFIWGPPNLGTGHGPQRFPFSSRKDYSRPGCASCPSSANDPERVNQRLWQEVTGAGKGEAPTGLALHLSHMLLSQQPPPCG